MAIDSDNGSAVYAYAYFECNEPLENNRGLAIAAVRSPQRQKHEIE
jgi:hypothetical protein